MPQHLLTRLGGTTECRLVSTQSLLPWRLQGTLLVLHGALWSAGGRRQDPALLVGVPAPLCAPVQQQLARQICRQLHQLLAFGALLYLQLQTTVACSGTSVKVSPYIKKSQAIRPKTSKGKEERCAQDAVPSADVSNEEP